MNAIKFLIVEHNRFRKVLTKIKSSKASIKIKKRMFNAFSRDIARHEKMEQTVWYPYLKKNTKLTPEIKHLLTEESGASKALAKIKKIADEEKWEVMFLEIKHDVFHHAKEEETKLFPKVAKQLEPEELSVLGKKMRVFKKASASVPMPK